MNTDGAQSQLYQTDEHDYYTVLFRRLSIITYDIADVDMNVVSKRQGLTKSPCRGLATAKQATDASAVAVRTSPAAY